MSPRSKSRLGNELTIDLLTILNKIGHGGSLSTKMATVQKGIGVDYGEVAASMPIF